MGSGRPKGDWDGGALPALSRGRLAPGGRGLPMGPPLICSMGHLLMPNGQLTPPGCIAGRIQWGSRELRQFRETVAREGFFGHGSVGQRP